MALIKCKYCGHSVSDKAVRCPKCGGDLTQTEEPKQEVEVRGTNANKITESPQLPNSDGLQDWYDGEPQKGNGLKILLVILAVIAVGGIGYFLYWNNQQKELKAAIEAAQQDSIAAAQLLAEQEAARLDSIRQDSIRQWNERYNFTSPDLAFFDLHGDVKTAKTNIHLPIYSGDLPGIIPFNKKGIWEQQVFSRNTKGEITENTKEKVDTRGIGGQTFTWKNGRLTGIEDWYGSHYDRLAIQYDSNGFQSSVLDDEHFNGGEATTTIIYSNYIVDELGNWVQRKASITTVSEFWSIDSENTIRETTSKTEIEHREITYYKELGNKTYPLEEFLKLHFNK